MATHARTTSRMAATLASAPTRRHRQTPSLRGGRSTVRPATGSTSDERKSGQAGPSARTRAATISRSSSTIQASPSRSTPIWSRTTARASPIRDDDLHVRLGRLRDRGRRSASRQAVHCAGSGGSREGRRAAASIPAPHPQRCFRRPAHHSSSSAALSQSRYRRSKPGGRGKVARKRAR